MSNKLTIQDVNSAITQQDWTPEQLTSMMQAIKFARARTGRKTIWQLRIGAKVKFIGRQGREVVGEVIKIKQKNVLVREGFTTWNVPASMLSEA